MSSLTVAPGAPGGRPTWTSSAKDMVTTALGTSRLWVTVGYGIVNEIYWPATGKPQIRDLGFIVTGPFGWRELKRVNQYVISKPEPFVPLPQIVHEGEGYRLELELVPDSKRDVLQIAYRLIGEGLKLYVLLAPHLDNDGERNNARAGDDLIAWKGNTALCLASDSGFSRSSAGYVGVSDGWQDFNQNGLMAWTYNEATNGNVALLGEVGSNEGTLALGFADTREGARTLARSSLSEGFAPIRQHFIEGWEKWGKNLSVPRTTAEIEREAYISAVVLRVHEDRTYPGSIVASLSVPWGNTSDSSGGYHLVWPRDCVEAGLALIAVGQFEDARRMLGHLIATQLPDGRWYQNMYPDGRAFWHGIQLDEVGFPIILAAKLAEKDALAGMGGVGSMIRRATAFIVQNGPITAQDRWEENPGASPFSLTVQIVALIAAAGFIDDADDRAYMLSLASYWNERIEDWTYIENGPLAEAYGVDGYYVRVGPSLAEGGLRGRVEIHNRSGETIPAVALVGMEYLVLVRSGLRDANDPRIRNTLKITEALLRVDTPQGVAYRRYNEDGYGEHADGSPFDGQGIGRAWPLLTGERGHYELQLGRDPLPYLRAMARMTGRTGLIPEQVWDSPAIPSFNLEPGKPTGSAMPLVWAHAEYLKLLCARETGRPLEMLPAVQAHAAAGRQSTGTWHWRSEVPFDTLPCDRDISIEASAPFLLHVGFDGWQGIEDRPSSPLPFGRHGARLTARELAHRSVIDFTLYFTGEECWEGIDHHVRVGDSPTQESQNTAATVVDA
ncbi:MAG TPA: glycoside hydrolase family 15 protein [Rhizomicrobium sp.]|jgi:glucoamylase